MSADLPEPRQDGYCADCVARPAETTDGRFCKKCLKKRISHANPMTGCFKGMYRTSEHKQASGDDGGPSADNAVRNLEGD